MINLAGRKIAVFDAEIKVPIEKCSRGWNSHDEMGVACLVIFDYLNMRYRVFNEDNASEAMAILHDYDFVVGFNTVRFDWPLIQATYPDIIGGRTRKATDCDILRQIWISRGLNPDVFVPRTHGGFKLDDVAFDTIGMRKTLSGEQAPILFQQGRLVEVIDYCLEDVRIERALFEFAVQHGYIIRGGQQFRIQFAGLTR